MPDLRGLYVESTKEHPLWVTARHSQWLELPESERVFSEEAIVKHADVLRGKYKHPRAGRFSPSGVGGCKRKMLFSYHGAPELPEDIDSPDVMALGNFGHYRWQLEGITRGWMVDTEVWTFNRLLRVGGSIDAMLLDDSIFELKTVHPYKFNKLTQVRNEPLDEHLLQTATYTLLEGVDLASIVYEDRGTGAFYEFRVQVDDALVNSAQKILVELNNHVEDNTLPPMLPLCKQKTGTDFKQCQFRKHCPAVAMASGEL